MNSANVCKGTWSDIVKGKVHDASPTAQMLKLEEEAPQFKASAKAFVPRRKRLAINEPKMNASAQEFVPSPTQSLSPSAKEFTPPEHKLLNKAAEMQRLLLECYTDDDSSDGEAQPPVVQKRKLVRKKAPPTIAPFRAPPGLSPPKDASLNPYAEVFDPPAAFVLNSSAKEFAPAAPHVHQSDVECHTINFAGFCSDSSDDESPVSTPRNFAKSSLLQDDLAFSTSAGESSESEAESWSA